MHDYRKGDERLNEILKVKQDETLISDKNKNPNNQNKKPKFKEVVVYCNETVYTGACEVHFMSDNVSFRY